LNSKRNIDASSLLQTILNPTLPMIYLTKGLPNLTNGLHHFTNLISTPNYSSSLHKYIKHHLISYSKFLTNYSTQVEDPSPGQHLLNPIANGEGQTVADVDAPVVDADGSASILMGEVVPNDRHGKDRHGKGTATCSSEDNTYSIETGLK